MEFNASSTTEDVIKERDLTGKKALVTGASSGLGVETALSLARIGAKVILVARDRNKVEDVKKDIESKVTNAQISYYLMDLSDLSSVRQCAKEILNNEEHIDILINNAGVMACPLDRTKEGCELQFGTNHIGHFLLTGLIAPLLKKGQSTRVISLSSGGHKFAAMDFDDPHFNKREYNKWVAYGQSKTANALFAVELNKRLQANGGRAFSVHPGMIVTELGRHLDEEDLKMFGNRSDKKDKDKNKNKEKKPRPAGTGFKSIPQGAATSVWAASHPSLEGKGGEYLEDCHIAELSTKENPNVGYLPHAADENAAAKLWKLSEEIVGETFDFA